MEICVQILVRAGLLSDKDGLLRATSAAHELKEPLSERKWTWRRHNIGVMPSTFDNCRPTCNGVGPYEETEVRHFLQRLCSTGEIKIREAVGTVCGVWETIAGDTLRGSRILDVGFGSRVTLAVGVDDTLHGPRILDVGGGHGRYAAAFANAIFGAQVTLLDREAATHIAHEIVGNAFGTRSGDFLQDDLGGPYDIAFLSYILSSVSTNEARRLLRRVHDILAPGGAIVIGDLFVDEIDQRAAFAVGLSIPPENEAIQFKTTAEIIALLTEAGFCQHERIRISVPDYGFVVARE
jgi:SAM-dependent methyltransferase